MNEKIIIEKVKQIQDTPISPQNMNAIIINCSKIKRPSNPEPQSNKIQWIGGTTGSISCLDKNNPNT